MLTVDAPDLDMESRELERWLRGYKYLLILQRKNLRSSPGIHTVAHNCLKL